ncbi:pentapeptide repeat-containing protein [Rhodococcus cerastii]|nr:pentapeptide repeat-containing protein [Rhodococcus cerastii]
MNDSVMQHLVMSHAIFDGAEFDDADLRGAFGFYPSFVGATFDGTRLDRDDNNRGTILHTANFTKATFHGVQAHWMQVSINSLFTGATLTDSDFGQTDLSSAVFIGARIQGNTTFFRANLRDAKFQAAVFNSVDLRGANLTNANFKGATLTAVNLTDADLSGATWTDGRICGQGSTGRCA